MIDTIVFDLGAVLIDWNPRYMYKTLFDNEEEMEHFLANITTSDWNEEQDAGRPLEEGTDLLIQQYPQHRDKIKAFYGRWHEMLGDAFVDTVEIFKQLKETNKYRIYALTNWSAETFPIAQERFPFLQWFDGIVVSGEEKIRKPAPAFYTLLLARYHLYPQQVLFIDDNYRNVLAARDLGIETIHFINADQLKNDLLHHNIL